MIVFREGLEAVLILAAITASFTGARRAFRRPVLIGGLVGLLATAVTYLLAQKIIDALGDGGLRLRAITGVLAIAVLLVVTNWFFHKVYWSEWIGRFNKRRLGPLAWGVSQLGGRRRPARCAARRLPLLRARARDAAATPAPGDPADRSPDAAAEPQRATLA